MVLANKDVVLIDRDTVLGAVIEAEDVLEDEATLLAVVEGKLITIFRKK